MGAGTTWSLLVQLIATGRHSEKFSLHESSLLYFEPGSRRRIKRRRTPKPGQGVREPYVIHRDGSHRACNRKCTSNTRLDCTWTQCHHLLAPHNALRQPVRRVSHIHTKLITIRRVHTFLYTDSVRDEICLGNVILCLLLCVCTCIYFECEGDQEWVSKNVLDVNVYQHGCKLDLVACLMQVRFYRFTGVSLNWVYNRGRAHLHTTSGITSWETVSLVSWWANCYFFFYCYFLEV